MKRLFGIGCTISRRGIFGILLFLFMMLTYQIDHAQAKNLVPDASFEKGKAIWVSGDSSSSIDGSIARSGSKSLKLINNGSRKNHNAGQYNIAGVQPGVEYEYNVWVKAKNVTGHGKGGKPLAVIQWRNGKGDKIAKEMYLWAPYGTYNWQALKINLEAPPSAAKVDIVFRSWWDCLTGTTNWDDVSLQPRNLSYRGNITGTYQAEEANIKSGGAVQSAETNYTGKGYFRVTSNTAYLEWNNVSGGATGGARILSFRYALEGGEKYWEVSVNGVSQGTAKPSATGRVNSWASSDWQVKLKPGNNKIRVKMQKSAGPLMDKLTVFQKSGKAATNEDEASNNDDAEPTAGAPIPGILEAEDFDEGGEGTGYHDMTGGNSGTQYRSEDVDIWHSGAEGYYIGATANGEWLAYTVDVGTAGQHRLDLRVATPNSGRLVHLEMDGKNVTGPVKIPNTGAWNTWQTVKTIVNLEPGQHVLRIVFDQGGINLNRIEIHE